jgi:hypothetical protein
MPTLIIGAYKIKKVMCTWHRKTDVSPRGKILFCRHAEFVLWTDLQEGLIALFGIQWEEHMLPPNRIRG